MDWKYWILVWIFTFFKSIFIKGTVVWEDRVRFLREPIENVIISSGSDVELPCLAVDSGGRRLSVRWLRNGVLVDDLTPRSNGSLMLRNVQIEREAVYQCAVLSTRFGVVLSRRANVTISKMTNFTAEPQDVEASTGGAARFQCLVAADSTPPISITWFYNGLPLDNDGQRIRILPSGILQIAKLKKSDEGLYHCVASNSIGNITSRTAKLTASDDSLGSVSGQQVEFRVLKAPSNISINIGRQAIFECLFEGADDVIWKKLDSPPISSRAYQIGTNLLIENVSPSDEGKYVCIGSNSAGKSLTLLAHLSVDLAPEIRKLPEEKLSKRGEWWRFHCDTASKPAPEIVWYKDGEQLRSHGRVKIFPNEEQPPNRLEKPSGEVTYGRDLLISSVQAEDVGIYQCFSSNYLGTVSAAAALSYVDVDLDGPSNLSAIVLSNHRDIQLTWHPPDALDEHHQLTVYIVHFHESESGSENTVAVQPDACHGRVCYTVCCSNVDLLPYTNYTFWVDALVVYQGEPLFTRTTDAVVITSGDAVSLSIASATIQELPDFSQIRLSWHSPTISELRGELLEYQIDIKEILPDSDERRHTVEVPYTTYDYLIEGLIPNSVVFCRVIPRTRAGYPDLLPNKIYPWLEYKTRTSAVRNGNVSGAPTIHTQALNSSSFVVQWDPIDHPTVTKWRVLTFAVDSGLTVARSIVDGNTNSVLILGLAADTWYQVSVTPFDEKGEGLSSFQLIKTLTASSPHVVAALVAADPVIPFPLPKCEVVGPGKLKVFWNTPPMNIVKFALRYSLLPDDNEPMNVSAYVKQLETTTNSIEFTDLIASRNYLFAVRAENADGFKSAFSDDISCLIPLMKPPPPTDLEVTVTNGTFLFIKWTSSPDINNVGEILFYHIRHTSNFTEPGSWKEITVNGSRNSVYISVLNSSLVFAVSVSAENEAGRGAESYIKRIQIRDHNDIDPLTNVTPTIIFRTSYKEGIIVGICIAVVCAAVCAAIIFLCSRRDRHFFVGCMTTRRRSTSAKTSTCYAPNGQCIGDKRIELAEIQTLLPRLMENTDSDSKGASGFNYVKGHPITKANFSLQPHSACMETNTVRLWESSQPHNELLTVAIQPSCTESEQHGERSSDLSQSPATGSSLGSWIHSNCNGDLLSSYKRHHGSLSMPNLFDSGIGFDDPSVSFHAHTRHLPSFSNCSPVRQINIEPPADSVTLPGCGLTTDRTPCNNANHEQPNGKTKRLWELFGLRHFRELRNGQMSILASSRATSNCTC